MTENQHEHQTGGGSPDAACSASYIDMTLTAKGLRYDVSKYLRRVADVIDQGWCHATFGWKEVGQWSGREMPPPNAPKSSRRDEEQPKNEKP